MHVFVSQLMLVKKKWKCCLRGTVQTVSDAALLRQGVHKALLVSAPHISELLWRAACNIFC